jgi:hypothetical protein
VQTQRLGRAAYKKVEYIRIIYQNHKMTNPTPLAKEVQDALEQLSETGNFHQDFLDTESSDALGKLTPVQAANCLQSVLDWMIDTERDWALRSRGRGVRSAAIREVNVKIVETCAC